MIFVSNANLRLYKSFRSLKNIGIKFWADEDVSQGGYRLNPVGGVSKYLRWIEEGRDPAEAV